jgi:hypothetical protein
VVTLCVLRSGGDFKPEHVQLLARQVKGLVCLSDVPVPGVQTIPLQYGWPGWFSKLEMCRPDIEGDVFYLDLDTVVHSLPEMPKSDTVLRDFYYPQRVGSGLMYLTEETRKKIWAKWIQAPEKHMRECVTFEKWGDQGFIEEFVQHATRWQDIAKVYSYKAHGFRADAQITCFHGKPRPWDLKGTYSMKTFEELILKHKGKRICVMGGAQSLEADLKKVKADVYISTNGHGLEFQEADYLFAMDETNRHHQMPMGEYLRSVSSAPIISPRGYADYALTKWPQAPRDVLSGMTAAWAAMMMGASVVILAGMDAYEGDAGYVDEARKMARDIHVPVRVFSDALQQVWTKYDGREKFKDYEPPSVIDTWLGVEGEIEIEVLRATTMMGRDVLPGQRYKVLRHDVRRLLKHRMIKEV